MDKARQRALALGRRRALSDAQRREYSEIICRRLLELPELSQARHILSYMALYDEADMALFNRELIKSGRTPALPLSLGGGMMEARIPGEIRRGRYGIAEPVREKSVLLAPELIDAVIMPCLAFDRELNRLGHGCGYYDRYLPACRGALKICVGFECQRLERLCTGELDTAADMAVSERGIYR